MNFSPFAQSTFFKCLSFSGGRALAAALGVGVLAEKSDAAVMVSMDRNAGHIALGQANDDGLFWVKANFNGINYNFGGLKLSNEYGLINMHSWNYPGNPPSNLLMVGTGDNFLTNPGQTSTVSVVYTPPAWNVNDPFGSPDFAIIRFDTPLTGPSINIAPPNTVNNGDILTMVGFGWPAIAGQGFFPQRDGNVRGFRMVADNGFPGNVNSSGIYGSAYFSSNLAIDLIGNGSTEDSGGKVMKNGLVTGIISAGIGGTEPNGSLYYYNITNNPIIQSFVPEPTSLAAVTLATLLVLRRRER